MFYAYYVPFILVLNLNLRYLCFYAHVAGNVTHSSKLSNREFVYFMAFLFVVLGLFDMQVCIAGTHRHD